MRHLKIQFLLLITLFIFLFPNSIKASSLVNWSTTNSITTSIASHGVFVYNNKIYIFGGANEGVPEVGVYSDILSAGLLDVWQNYPQPTSPRFWHAYTQNSHYAYLLGGTNETITNTSSVVYADIGSLSPWQETTPLPQPLALGASVVVGNKIYFAGGNPSPSYSIDSNTNQNIYSADINLDGTLGSWDVAGQLPDRLIGFGLMEINNYLYVFGGSGSAGYTGQVYRVKILPDGNIDSGWETLSSIPQPVWRFGITKSGNTIVIAGGQGSDGSILNNVYYSDVKTDGTLENWQSGPDLPYPNCCSPLVSYGNAIYLVGGHDGENYTDRVLITKITDEIPNPTPSPLPTDSPIPSSNPTPTEKPVNKVFLIPGVGASWNIDAFRYCKNTGYTGDWTLAPYAEKYYNEIINQLPDHNWGTYPFYYDWRQNIKLNAAKLTDYINLNSNSDEKVNIVGHSMGGLIGGDYIETQNGGRAYKFLAVGAPFKGSALSYPTFVDGEVWDTDIVSKIGKTLFINHCGVPSSIQNLLPTYNYIRDIKTKQIKDVATMKAKNNYLPTDFISPFWGVKVGTLTGSNQKTLKIINTTYNKDWPDGKPVNKEYSNLGDGTVLLESAQLPGAFSNQVINQDHSGIIASTEGVNKVLEFLGSPGITDPPYIGPKSALILVGYPGNFWLTDKDGKVTQSEQGLIGVMDPKDGDFQLQITPTSNNTQFIAAQFLENGKTLYKEYKFKGVVQEPKIIHFDSKHPNEDIVKNVNEYKKPNFPKFWFFFWNYWNKINK